MGGPGEHESVAEQSVGDYLGRLASRTPMPAGGVVCALQAAQAAALVAMVARFSVTEGSDPLTRLIEDADRLRDEAVRIAEEDPRAYAGVSAAYALPHDHPERRASIAAALIEASRPPTDVISVVEQVVTLTEKLVPVVNPMLKADLAVACDVALAAASGARVTVEANLRGVSGDGERDRLLASLDPVDEMLRRTVAVRESLRQKSTDESVHTA